MQKRFANHAGFWEEPNGFATFFQFARPIQVSGRPFFGPDAKR